MEMMMMMVEVVVVVQAWSPLLTSPPGHKH